MAGEAHLRQGKPSKNIRPSKPTTLANVYTKVLVSIWYIIRSYGKRRAQNSEPSPPGPCPGASWQGPCPAGPFSGSSRPGPGGLSPGPETRTGSGPAWSLPDRLLPSLRGGLGPPPRAQVGRGRGAQVRVNLIGPICVQRCFQKLFFVWGYFSRCYLS